MIRRGRQEGWLRCPIDRLEQWARLSGASFDGVKIGRVAGFEHRGSSVIADRHFTGERETTLITVPRDMVLSLDVVQAYSKRCKPLGEVLDALGGFGQTSRGAILVYLLFAATSFCPDIFGDSAWVSVDAMKDQYIKFLPSESLPTFWTADEINLFEGTTLKSAVDAKMRSLEKEFDILRSKTAEIIWCSKFWWDSDSGQLGLDDWLQVDAMYRSRALECPKIGDCMLPCIDMANHASRNLTVARYDIDGDGDPVLLLRNGMSLNAGDEVTITYGDEKGMCEMIFCYGFVEDHMDSARQLFLRIDIPADDPLKFAKLHISPATRGVTIFEDEDGVGWHSDFIWLVCLNEEDGLEFRVLQTTDGGRELRLFWKEQEVKDLSKMCEMLQRDENWALFKLRAVALVQNRTELQLQILSESGKRFEQAKRGAETAIRDGPYQLAAKLRKNETLLLNRLYDELESQKCQLAATDAVKRFLASAMDEDPINFHGEGNEDREDFT